MRRSEINRKTAETEVEVELCLDGPLQTEAVGTGVGFLDHMLELFARHSGFGLRLSCRGDTEVDAHHSVEDTGLALGEALREALGDKRGIRRYGGIALPMDEALVLCAVDLSGRPCLRYAAQIPSQKVGEFDTELVRELTVQARGLTEVRERAIATLERYGELAASMEKGTKDVSAMGVSARLTMESLQRLVREDSAPLVEFSQTMRALRDAANSIDNLATLLELKPDALIFGRRP